MKKAFNLLGFFAFTMLLMMLGTDFAFAGEAKDVAAKANEQIEAFVELLGAFAYIGGIGFGIRTAMKLKEYNDAKGQVSLSQPLWNGVVAALLIALPSLMNTLAASLWGAEGTKVDVKGSNMKSL